MFEGVMRSIGDAVGLWLYLIAGALAFSEAAFMLGFVLPGEIALLVAGYFSNPSYGHLNLGVMIVIAIVCAVAGDSVGFEFGRVFGPAMRHSRVGRIIGEQRWSSVDAFIHKHGGKAVLFGRMVALMRALMPSMAGMSGMRYRTFLLWNAAGGILWGGGCVILGYVFASALATVSSYLTWAPLAVVAVLVAVVVVRYLRRRSRERDEADAFAAADAVQPEF